MAQCVAGPADELDLLLQRLVRADSGLLDLAKLALHLRERLGQRCTGLLESLVGEIEELPVAVGQCFVGQPRKGVLELLVVALQLVEFRRGFLDLELGGAQPRGDVVTLEPKPVALGDGSVTLGGDRGRRSRPQPWWRWRHGCGRAPSRRRARPRA